jgi:hypothetical protein
VPSLLVGLLTSVYALALVSVLARSGHLRWVAVPAWLLVAAASGALLVGGWFAAVTWPRWWLRRRVAESDHWVWRIGWWPAAALLVVAGTLLRGIEAAAWPLMAAGALLCVWASATSVGESRIPLPGAARVVLRTLMDNLGAVSWAALASAVLPAPLGVAIVAAMAAGLTGMPAISGAWTSTFSQRYRNAVLAGIVVACIAVIGVWWWPADALDSPILASLLLTLIMLSNRQFRWNIDALFGELRGWWFLVVIAARLAAALRDTAGADGQSMLRILGTLLAVVSGGAAARLGYGALVARRKS